MQDVKESSSAGKSDRAYLVDVMTRITSPVLRSQSGHPMSETFPVRDWDRHRQDFSRVEALSRTLAGIAPWIELAIDDENSSCKGMGEIARESLLKASDPESQQSLRQAHAAKESRQLLVEAAFLAHALLRAPNVLWHSLKSDEQENVAAWLRESRRFDPCENNWLLFAAIVEAALWKFTGSFEKNRLRHAIDKHREWYQGDGTYGDGPEFRWDYYNSYVIHPMLLDVLKVCRSQNDALGELFDEALQRAKRYAEILERQISPEGTFPVIGRSSAYRFASFQSLSQLILWKKLPATVSFGAVRSGLTAVIRRMVEAPGTFDDKGWLEVGSVGRQPFIAEEYVSSGSLYLCVTGLLHLGLPPKDPFWLAPAGDRSQKHIWSGQDITRDQALK